MLKQRKYFSLAVAIMLLIALTACTLHENAIVSSEQSHGRIYLYGEQHGIEEILEKEFEIWNMHYRDSGLRHLFLEMPYYTAEFLNIWMASDSDDILDALYDDLDGTAAQIPAMKDFYKKIKDECPDTVFHGTDVGHQYDTTGKRFLSYLELEGLKDSEQYVLTQKNIEQGERFYKNPDDFVYRENRMTQNFIRAFDLLQGESVMGIYGAAHTRIGALDPTGTIACMANQLTRRYGDIIQSEDLSWIAPDMEPLRLDTIEIDGKGYQASYFGRQDLAGFRDFAFREYWRLESAYEDFKEYPKTGDFLPYSNYPMAIEIGQVFVLDYTRTDGSVTRVYYRSDGSSWQGLPATEQFFVK